MERNVSYRIRRELTEDGRTCFFELRAEGRRDHADTLRWNRCIGYSNGTAIRAGGISGNEKRAA